MTLSSSLLFIIMGTYDSLDLRTIFEYGNADLSTGSFIPLHALADTYMLWSCVRVSFFVFCLLLLHPWAATVTNILVCVFGMLYRRSMLIVLCMFRRWIGFCERRWKWNYNYLGKGEETSIRWMQFCAYIWPKHMVNVYIKAFWVYRIVKSWEKFRFRYSKYDNDTMTMVFGFWIECV